MEKLRFFLEKVVFSKSYCPYCKATKSTLSDLGAEFTTYELDQLGMYTQSTSSVSILTGSPSLERPGANTPAVDGSEQQNALEALSGQRTVPNVFINREHIGGNSEVQGLFKSGELQKRLREAGALKA